MQASRFQVSWSAVSPPREPWSHLNSLATLWGRCLSRCLLRRSHARSHGRTLTRTHTSACCILYLASFLLTPMLTSVQISLLFLKGPFVTSFRILYNVFWSHLTPVLFQTPSRPAPSPQQLCGLFSKKEKKNLSFLRISCIKYFLSPSLICLMLLLWSWS